MTPSYLTQQITRHAQEQPHKTALHDTREAFTYAQVDDLSGRVCAYLRQRGVGREQFVMVLFPRGVRSVVAMLGVWRAGAALVCCEESDPEARIEVIEQASHCVLRLTEEVWPEILSLPSDPTPACVDPHDAAYALFTSGSTGTPRGVVHEYGKMPQLTHCIVADGSPVYVPSTRVAMPLPVSTTSGFIHTFSPLAAGGYVDIIPFSLLGDAAVLESYLIRERITVSGVVSSMLGKHRIHSPYMKVYITGSERTVDAYMEGFTVLNTYGQTETSFAPATFVIDRNYANTPIGSAAQCPHVHILDDDLRPVPRGEEGELYVDVTYTRGYIDNVALTAEVYTHGMCRTGDLAVENAEGNIVVTGRRSDMVKINGHRVEPAEIEAAVRQVLGVEWTVVHVFHEADATSICAYYTADIQVDVPAVQQALMDVLPHYMVPTHYMRLSEVPRLSSGKVDRRRLPQPDMQGDTTGYVSPANPLEEHLCRVMQHVLGVSRVGVADDFFLLGGDSLSAIRLVQQCALPSLSVSDVYSARTPRAIATLWIAREAELPQGNGGGCKPSA